MTILRLKKEREFLFGVFHARFLSRSRPTTAIAIIIAITPTAIEVIRFALVATSVKGVDVGAGVGAAGSTAKEVIECDGQYDSEPAKAA